MEKLQSDTSFVILPTDKGRSTVILNRENYLEKCMDVKDENNNAKNSITFSNYIRNVPIEDDEITVSFGATFLYTNIPIIDTLNVIKDYVNNNAQFTWKTAIPLDKFLDLLYLALTTFWYTFSSQFYQQTDGMAMRGPGSSTTAEIYMRLLNALL